MPTYELQMGGKEYEVEAPSMEAAMGALKPWEQDYHGDTGAPVTTGSMPWDRDWSHLNQQQGDFLHPVKPAAGSGWRGVMERIGQYPRIALGELHDAIDTLGRVGSGELDATHPDAIKAATNLASVIGPAGEFAGTGGQIARRAFSPGEANPAFVAPSAGMRAAQTAVDVGQPLPAGIVSETPGVQAFTQAFRQAPFVGPTITHKVGQTVEAAGNRVGGIAEELSGGPVSDRATVGANTRQSLQDVIEANNSRIDRAFDDLRSNHIDPDAMASLPRTEAALKGILRERAIAGMKNPESGLADVANLIDQGTSFNGLQRARSDIGSQLDAFNPNPGFHAGDMKRVYRAMSADLEGIARYHAKVDPDEAAAAFKTANSTAQELINRNSAIRKLIGNKSDEGMLGGIINSARDKTGNLRQLAALRQQLPKEDFEKIVGVALNELGHTPEGFSLNQFAGKRGWGGLSDSAKSVLIADPAHRKALDDIAGLGNFLKNADKYRNTSNTGHAVGIGGLAVLLAEHGLDIEKLPWLAAGAAGGYGLSQILARPVTAKRLAAMARSVREGPRTGLLRAPAGLQGLSIAGQGLPRLPQGFENPSSYADRNQQQRYTPIPRPDPRRKIQDRYPAPAY